MKLCCIFNYAPAYRTAIYKKIDDSFDTQFFFAEETEYGKSCDIKKMDYSILKRFPKRIENRKIWKWGWTSGILTLPFNKYDAFIVTANIDFAYIPFLLLCRILKKPVYAWGHGLKKWDWKTLGADRLIIKLCTLFFTYGEKGKQRMIDMGIPNHKVDVIYNSLCDSVKVNENQKLGSNILKLHFNNDYPTLLFVGRLTPVKKLDWLIRAITIHDKKNIKYNLLVVGDGTEYNDLVFKANQTGLSNRIWFYGECYEKKELDVLIYNSELCVSPGNVGLTALHAMMYGTPVLSHDDFETQMPEYETIVEGVTGSLYKHGSFDDFCDKISNWIQNVNNRDIIRRNCYDMINGRWNTIYQIGVLNKYLKY